MRLFLSRIKDWLMQPLLRSPAVTMNQADLMARFSHEMRTSLTGIVGYSEFVESTSAEPMVNFTAKIIRESSQGLARASNAFFDLQSIESGQLKLNCTWFSMHDLVCNAIRLHQPMARERDVSLLFTCSDDLFLIEMYADVLRVRQVVDALIYGAIQSTRKDESVHIDMMLDRLKVGVMLKIFFLDVRADSTQIELLKEFWGGDSYKFRLQEGPGIELALTKGLIYFMQGIAVYRASKTQPPELLVSLPIRFDLSKRCA
jgi:signal transduction histidine kinase